MRHFVFVYGTLKEDVPTVDINDRQRYENCHLQGFRMEGHSSFPGVKPGSPKDIVVGELIEYHEEEILNRLDRIEGYNPNSENNTFYDRRKAMVRTPNGDIIEAYVYIYMSDGMNLGEDCHRIDVTTKEGYTYYNWVGQFAAW